MRIVMAGATGLVGQLLLDLLVQHVEVESITAVGRRSGRLYPGKVFYICGPAENWPSLVPSGDVAISTLGTTIRQAGSRAAFAAIDLEAAVGFAAAAHRQGARQFLMVSSVGANAASSNFYLQTKGRAEEAVRALGFDRVDIFRPGLLRGNREGPARTGERIGIALSPLTDLLTPRALDKYRSIAASEVATVMARVVGAPEEGVFVHHNREMQG